MQQLHLVGLTADHTGLILSTRRGAKTGKYSVSADEKLLAAVQEAQRLLAGGDAAEATSGDDDATSAGPEPVALPPPPPAKPVSSLSPREIQGRLRAGDTVSEIASAAGVDEEWILRFADPIRAEQARVVERAQRLTFNKPRLGLSAEPLETSVLLNLAERGVRLPADVFATAWTAFNLHGTSWAVVFSYTSRQRRQAAQWEVDLRSGDLIARNRLASDLGYLEPGRRRRRMEPLEVPGEDDSAKLAPRPAGAKKAVGAKKPPMARKAPAKKSASVKTRGDKKVASKKSAAPPRASSAKKGPGAKPPAAVKKAPAAKGGGRQSSPRGRRPAKKPAAKKPAPQGTGASAASAPLTPEPPVLSDRPTHLARPSSPMNLSNRAVNVPGRLVGAPSLRPPLPPAPRPRRQAMSPPPSSRSRPRHDAAEEIGFAPDRGPAASVNGPTDDERAPSRPEDQPAAPPGGHSAEVAAGSHDSEEPRGEGAGESTPPRVGRKRRSERLITPRSEDKPSVVILSTPAVRRLEPADEPGRRGSPPS